MGLSGSVIPWRIVVIIFAVLFLVLGVVVLAIGAWVLADTSVLMKLVAHSLGAERGNEDIVEKSLVEAGAYVLITFGVVSLVTGILGILGAVKANVILLCGFAGFFIAIVLAEIVCAGIAIAYRNEVENKLKSGLAVSMSAQYRGLPYGAKAKNSVSLGWDWVMINYNCCGINGYEDFKTNHSTFAATWYKSYRSYTVCMPMNEVITKFKSGWNPTNLTTKMIVPVACCPFKDKKFVTDVDWEAYGVHMKDKTCPLNLKDVHKGGCFNKMKDRALKYATALIVTVAVGIFVQILGIIASIIAIKKLIRS